MLQLIRKTLITEDNISALPLRLALGLVMFVHGAQKMLGAFGGYGFAKTMNFFTEVMHFPWIIGFLVIFIEFFSSILLIIGLGTRINAILLTIILVGIIFTSHIQYGFFMNWFGQQEGEGIEFFILGLGLSIGLILQGGGKYSIDRLLTRTD